MKLNDLIADTIDLRQRYIDAPRNEQGYRILKGLPHMQSLVHDRVSFSNFAHADENKASVYFPTDFSMSEKDMIKISMHPSGNVVDHQETFLGILKMLQEANLSKGVSELEYKFGWEPTEFIQSAKLPSFFSGKVDIRSSIVEPQTNLPMGPGHIKLHMLTAEMEKNKLEIRTQGAYARHLGDVIESIKPQFATITLSEEDKQRMLSKLNAGELSHRLTRVLQGEPTKFESLYLSMYDFALNGSGYSQGMHRQIPITNLKELADAIGKPMLQSSDQCKTGVNSLTKIYGPFALATNQRVKDLKQIVRYMQDSNLGLMLDHPMITTREALKFLEEEMKMIENAPAGSFDAFFTDMSYWRGKTAKYMAGGLIGQHITEPFVEMGLSEYVSFLESHGYSPIEVSNSHEREMKEDHLFAFFKQEYVKNPDKAIEHYRQYFKNNKPLIVATTGDTLDASKADSVVLPQGTHLREIRMKDAKEWSQNYLSLWAIDMLLDEELVFSSNSNLHNPTILPIQQYAMDRLGIKIK